MLVTQLLKDKALAPEAIITIAPTATVADAAALLSSRRIGAVVVTTGGAPEGILSERDIVRELGRRGASVLEVQVAELMTRKVETCAPGDEALAVLERMTAGRFRHMPVLDGDGAMVGVISIGDAVHGRLKELAAEKDALTGMIMGA